MRGPCGIARAATRPLLDVRMITGWVAGVTMDERGAMRRLRQ